MVTTVPLVWLFNLKAVRSVGLGGNLGGRQAALCPTYGDGLDTDSVPLKGTRSWEDHLRRT